MNDPVEMHLKTVELRLGEAWEALSVQRTINELANEEVNVSLYSEINKFSGFWRTVNVALQVSIFTGIFALLDKKSSDSATLYSVLSEIKQAKPELSLGNIEDDLDKIKRRYEKYRHKLFAHNDKNRSDWIGRFNGQHFAWASLEEDFDYMDYVWKSLWLINEGQITQIKNADEIRQYQFPHNGSRRGVVKHTEEFLKRISPSIS